MKRTLSILVAAAAFAFSSCTHQVMDFTILSASTNTLQFNKSLGKPTTGKHLTFLGIGTSAQTATRRALQNAGPEYNLLIDGSITIKDYFFTYGYHVEGIAINSRHLVSQLGQEGYEQFLAEHEVTGEYKMNTNQ